MNLNENIHRIQSMMGLIVENDEITNRILDKISEVGYENLSKSEKQFLDNKSKGVHDDELEDVLNIDSGYEFNDTIDDLDIKFIYDETEEWDDDPVEYKHVGDLYVEDDVYSVSMYTDEDLNVHSFDLHDGEDFVELIDDFEDLLLEFFKKVGDKIKQNMI